MSGFPKNTSHAETISAITKPVEITDYIVTQKTGLGEFTNTNTNSFSALEDRVVRMGDHIEFLTKIANQEHENAHFELKGTALEMKADALNKVSRLTLNEFSLYSKGTPLSEKEFKTLLQRVNEIAQNSHENLHLILASVPLLGPDNQVHNIVMHVQCGKQPEVNCFAKFVPSPIDAVYPNTFNPSFIGKGVKPLFLDRKTNTGIPLAQLNFEEINNRIMSQFLVVKANVNLSNSSKARSDIIALLDTTCKELGKIKDPDYLPPQALTDRATKLLSDVKLANDVGKMRLLEADFIQFKKEMNDYRLDSNQKNSQFRNAVKVPVNIRTNAPAEVHVDDFGKYKIATTSKRLEDIVQATSDSLSDPNKHHLAMGWLNELQRNLLPGNVAVNKAIDDLKIIVEGRNDPRVAPARAFKDELDQAVGIIQKKPFTTAEYDQLNVFKAQYNGLLDDSRNILNGAQKLKIDTDVKPHFEKVFDKVMYTNMANVFAADMENLLKNYDKDPDYYAGMLELQKERLDTLIDKQNITEPKVLALSQQLDVMLKKIESEKPIEKSDFDLFVANKNELDAALVTVRTQNTISDGEIKAFITAKQKMDVELNVTILDGTVKADGTLTDSLKQKVKDYQENEFTEAVLKELNTLNTAWDTEHTKPEYQQKVGQIQKILTNIHNALSDSDKNQVKPMLDKLSENKKVDLLEIASLKIVLESNPNKLNQLPYSTFPVGESQDINYNPIVKCKTAGGAWFDTETQICLDHAFNTVQASRASMQRQETSTPLSPHVSHILTSNSMGLEAPRTYTDRVTHADRMSDKMGVIKINPTKTAMTKDPLAAFSVDPTTIKPSNSALYSTTVVTKAATKELNIKHPPFGPVDCVMCKYPAHVLSPLPLNNGSKVSQDSFSSSYYVSKLESILMSVPVSDEAVKQKKCVTDFAKDLATLKNKPDTKIEDFYNKLDKFREEIKKIGDEDTKKMLGHINSIENYLDTKLLPPQSFLSLRILNSLGDGLPLKASLAVDFLKMNLPDFDDKNMGELANAKEYADKLFDFKKEIYAIDDENTADVMNAIKKIEEHIENNYPTLHQELKNLHEEHADLGPSKLGEDYYQAKLDKITDLKNSKQQEVDAPSKINSFYFDKNTTADDLIKRVNTLLSTPIDKQYSSAVMNLRVRLELLSKKENTTDSVSKVAEDLARLTAAITRENFDKIFASAEKEHAVLQKDIEEARKSIKHDEERIVQLKEALPLLEKDAHLKQENLLLDKESLEVEKTKLSHIQKDKKEAEELLTTLRESHEELIRERDVKVGDYQEEVKKQQEIQSQLNVLEDEKGTLEKDKSVLLKAQSELQSEKESLDNQLSVNERQNSEINVRIDLAEKNLRSTSESKDTVLSNAEKVNALILGLENKRSSLKHQGEEVTREMAECEKQIKEYELHLTQLGPQNEQNKEDILRTTNQLSDLKERWESFQSDYHQLETSSKELNAQLDSANLERTALLIQVEKLSEQNEQLKAELKSLEVNQKLLQSERQLLAEKHQKVVEDISGVNKEIIKVTDNLEVNAEKNSELQSKLLIQHGNVTTAELDVDLIKAQIEMGALEIDRSLQKVEPLQESEKLQLKIVADLSEQYEERSKQNEIAQKKYTNSKDELHHVESELPSKKSELKKLTDKMEGVDSHFSELKSQKMRQEEAQKELVAKCLAADKTIKEDIQPKVESVEVLRNANRMK